MVAAYVFKALVTATVLAIAEASASCYVCSNCPLPLISGLKGARLLDHCSECVTTTVRIGGKEVFIRGCLWEGLGCDRFRATYRPPYSIQKMLGANSTTYDGAVLDDIVSQNVSHRCCASDMCNAAQRSATWNPLLLLFGLPLLLLHCIALP